MVRHSRSLGPRVNRHRHRKHASAVGLSACWGRRIAGFREFSVCNAVNGTLQRGGGVLHSAWWSYIRKRASGVSLKTWCLQRNMARHVRVSERQCDAPPHLPKGPHLVCGMQGFAASVCLPVQELAVRRIAGSRVRRSWDAALRVIRTAAERTLGMGGGGLRIRAGVFQASDLVLDPDFREFHLRPSACPGFSRFSPQT
jgi:hypothetical protein